eukprot:708780-Ditylum_brightwellii.AAC.1
MLAAMVEHIVRIDGAIRKVKTQEEELLHLHNKSRLQEEDLGRLQSAMVWDKQGSIHALRTIIDQLKQTESIAVEANKRFKVPHKVGGKEMKQLV